jgi:hypothetical protein
MNMKFRAGAALIFTLSLLPALDALAGDKKMTCTSLEAGIDSGIDDKSEFLIRNDTDWKSFWSKHKSRQMPVPAAPSVDFKKDMVIALVAGTKPNGGFVLKINSVNTTDKGVLVDATLTKPRPDQPTAQMMSQPFDIVKCQSAPGTLKVQWKEVQK